MKQAIVAAVVAVLTTGCGLGQGTVSDQGDETTTGSGLTWEQFRDTRAYVEPGTGFFIADHDTLFVNEKQLREFYEMNVREGQLIVNRIGSADDKWNATQKLNLTYCVSNSFGANKAAVVSAMAGATAAWKAVADIAFVYVPAQDASCTASNNNVMFDVNPVNVNGQYLARSFFPANARSSRNVLIDNTSFGDPSIPLVGILRHELGHTLGFRHEHTRPEAGATSCFEDNNWRALTSYDSSSVMHYPQCNGTNSFSNLVLTALDAQGAAALYGAPGGGGTGGGAGGGTGGGTAGGTGGGSGGGAGGTATTETFSATVAANGSKSYGPFAVTPGSNFHAVLSGTGDADLYVRFGAAPTASTFACRPYLNGSAEDCNLTVPSTATSAYIAVNGYTASTFSLSVTYTKGTATPPPTTGTPKTSTVSGSVAKGQLLQFAALPIVPGTQLTVTMSGTGDPDLYVRFAGAPSLTAFDCRPYVNGASESCSVTVPAGASQFFMAINGYTAGSYSLTANYVAP